MINYRKIIAARARKLKMNFDMLTELIESGVDRKTILNSWRSNPPGIDTSNPPGTISRIALWRNQTKARKLVDLGFSRAEATEILKNNYLGMGKILMYFTDTQLDFMLFHDSLDKATAAANKFLDPGSDYYDKQKQQISDKNKENWRDPSIKEKKKKSINDWVSKNPERVREIQEKAYVRRRPQRQEGYYKKVISDLFNDGWTSEQILNMLNSKMLKREKTNPVDTETLRQWISDVANN